MVLEAFTFQEGPVRLTDEEAEADIVDKKTKFSKFDTFTTVLHFFSVYLSTAGVVSLGWAYLVIIGFEKPWPAFREVFMDDFAPVVVLLSISIIWSLFNMWLLRKRRLVPQHVFILVYNVSMTICLVYFPTVCCCRLYDQWSTIACAYFSNNEDENCLPIYSKILEPEVVSLGCAFAVALFHLLHITGGVILFIMQMNDGNRSTLFSELLHKGGYSTRVAIYGVCWALALIGWSMMLWAYDFITTFGTREGDPHKILATQSYAGFDILFLMLKGVQLWFLANVVSMCLRQKPISSSRARFYQVGMALGLICISIRCATQLEHLEECCQWDEECIWIWRTIRPRQLAAIILAFLVGLIHLSLCLNWCHSSLRWVKDKNRIYVLLNSLIFNEDFGGIAKVYAHTWTDEQIASVFRIKTSGDEVREYIAKVLHQIRNEEVAAFNNTLSNAQIARNASGRKFCHILDRTEWDDKHLALLLNSLHGEPKEDPASKMIRVPRRYRHRINNLKEIAKARWLKGSVAATDKPQD